MAHYVMGDIHGEADRFHAMLERIHLSEEDTLILLGDVIDRGAGRGCNGDTNDGANSKYFADNPFSLPAYKIFKYPTKPINRAFSGAKCDENDGFYG